MEKYKPVLGRFHAEQRCENGAGTRSALARWGRRARRAPPLGRSGCTAVPQCTAQENRTKRCNGPAAAPGAAAQVWEKPNGQLLRKRILSDK